MSLTAAAHWPHSGNVWCNNRLATCDLHSEHHSGPRAKSYAAIPLPCTDSITIPYRAPIQYAPEFTVPLDGVNEP